MNWWSQIPYKISPYLIQINGFGIRYYSLMYLLAFVTVYFLIKYRLKTEKFDIDMTLIDDFIVWAARGSSRRPDDHLNYIWSGFTMGQILCFIMVLAGFSILIKIKLKN